jgi:hypothetical protein
MKWITKLSEVGPQRLVVEEKVSDRKYSVKLHLTTMNDTS